MAAKFRLRVVSIVTLILSLLLGLVGCSSSRSRTSPPTEAPGPQRPAESSTVIPPAPIEVRSEPIFPVMLGIDVLEHEGFAVVKGKRIGLLTHAAGVNRRGESTISVLQHAPGVRLVALFAPEHGLYGTEEAGKIVADTIDRRTGLPVYSSYGRTRKPSPEMLKGIDAMVIDLQDIGVRSYTFSSAMRYTMEACFQNNVEVVVLDRPNPLGGLIVDGPPMDANLMSYVGAFRVPYIHGMTIGELARMAAATPGSLAIPESVRLRGRLIVVPMRGWRRSMRWRDTGLPFIATSPFVQDFDSVIGYAMTGLGCEIGGFSHGTGHLHPFIAYKGRTSEQLQRDLEALRLPGLAFAKTTGPDAAHKPATGVSITVTDWAAWRPTELSFHMMRLACQWSSRNPFVAAPADKIEMFNKLVGSRAWWAALSHDGARVDVQRFLADWRKRAQDYQSEARRYWLYTE